MSSEQVRFDLKVDLQNAIEQIKDLAADSSSGAEAVKRLSDYLIKLSKDTKQPIDKLRESIRSLNQELSKSGGGFNLKVDGKNLLDVEKAYTTTAAAAGRFKQTNDGVVTSLNSTDTGFKSLAGSVNLVRTAFGTLIAIGIFQFLQLITSAIQGAITGLRELETATYNLANAEKNLSEQGISITPKDLDETIAKLQKLDPLLSKIQASELVSSIATRVAPQVGFNKDQIAQLSEAIAVLAIRNKGLGKSFEEVEKQVTDAFLTGKVSVAINNLGVKINDQIVRDEALRLGLVKTADEFDNLTGKMESNIKAQALLSLVSANANKDLSHLPDYFKTADAAFGIVQARVQDVLTKVGEKLGPVLQRVFIGLADLLTKILNYLDENDKALDTWVTGLTVVATAVLGVVEGFIKLTMWIGKAGSALAAFFNKVPFIGKLIERVTGKNPAIDTPTGTPTDSSAESAGETKSQEKRQKAVEDTEKKIQDAMKDSADKKLDIERDYGRKLEDIATNYSQKLEDIARKTSEKEEDALRGYNQKVEDINRDAAQKIAEAQADERKKELDREAAFQNRLRELREKFLFDLEDALRERDARQVLRLIRQYNMDKNNLEEKHKLEGQQAKKDLATKLADIEYERQKKLEAAKREYDEKLHEIQIAEARERAEAALWKKRQLEDARLWHQRQLQEQREYLQRKLRDLADALKAEYNMTSTGAQAMTSLLASAYGAYANLLSQFSNGTMTPVSANGAITGGSLVNSFPDFASTFSSLTSGHGYGFAEGGTLIATRPTRALFGENGPERVDITPLNHVGKNVGKVFGDTSSMGGGGSVKIALELSPDLEARIVESSLDGVAVTLEKIVRSK